MKTAKDFKEAVSQKAISRWIIHNCSICNYPCGYIFEDQPYYDSGCDCVIYSSPLQSRDWNDVAQQYNIQSSPEVIKEYDEFWGFK